MTSALTPLPERNLDVLRTVAVSCVLFDHLGLVLSPPGSDRLLYVQVGLAGVLLFFVHTSLVLMASLERQGKTSHWIATFYTRRAFRIYPLAIATVLLVLATHMPGSIPKRGLHGGTPVFSAARIVSNLLLMQNLVGQKDVLGPFWSLPLEVDMYLLLPFCFLAAQRSWKEMGALCVALLAAFFLVNSSAPGVWRLNVFNYGLCFFGGIAAFFLLRQRVTPRLPSWTLWAVLAVAIAVLPLVHATGNTYVRNWLPCLLVGLAIPFIRDAGESPFTRAAHVIARYSYGIYLLHVPVMRVVFDWEGQLPLGEQLVLWVAGLVAICWVAYHAVEKRGIQLGQRIVHRRAELAAMQPAP